MRNVLVLAFGTLLMGGSDFAQAQRGVVDRPFAGDDGGKGPSPREPSERPEHHGPVMPEEPRERWTKDGRFLQDYRDEFKDVDEGIRDMPGSNLVGPSSSPLRRTPVMRRRSGVDCLPPLPGYIDLGECNYGLDTQGGRPPSFR